MTRIEIKDNTHILASRLTRAQKAQIKQLYKGDLNACKKEFVGFRSESLGFFFESVISERMRVGIPNGHEGLRSKGAPGWVYLTVNPEAHFFNKQTCPQDFPPAYKGLSFRQLSAANVKSYSSIAFLDALSRDIMPNVDTKPLLDFLATTEEVTSCEEGHIQELYEFIGRQYECDFNFLGGYSSDIEMMRAVRRMSKTGGQISGFVEVLLNSFKGGRPENALNIVRYLISCAKERSGIFLAFSPKMFEKYRHNWEGDAVHELIFETDSPFPLDCLYGFEVLGIYEEEVLSSMGIE